MKKFLYLFAFLPLLSFGQIKTTYQAVSPNSGPSMNKNWGQFANIDVQYNLSIPVVSSPSYNNAVPRDGMIMLNRGDSLLYYSLGGTLHKLGGGGGGSGAVYFNSFYFSGLGSLTSPIIPNPNTILQQAYYVHNNAFTFKYDSLQVLNAPVNPNGVVRKQDLATLVPTIYTEDGTIITNRTVTVGSNLLSFDANDGTVDSKVSLSSTQAAVASQNANGDASSVFSSVSGTNIAFGMEYIDGNTGNIQSFGSKYSDNNVSQLGIAIRDQIDAVGLNYDETGDYLNGGDLTVFPRIYNDARYATAGSGVSSFNTRTGAVTLNSTDVTTALGFTPVPNTRTVAGFALSSNVTLANLSAGTGLTFSNYNGSSAITAKADTSVVQTVLNFFPKGDTRYARLSASNNFTGGFTSQYNGGSTYPFTSINNVGITNTTASGVGVTIQSNTISWLTGGFSGSLTMTPTANRTITLPDASGTVALTSGLPTGANPTASVTFTPVNGSATTFTRSDGAPKADSTVIRAVANSYSLLGMQTKLNNYLLKTDTTAMLGNVVHKALNETITGTKTFTPAPLFSAMTNHSVLFAGASGLLSQDNNNFYYNSGLLSIGTGGDFTGTNTVNIYGQYDAYEPQSAIGTVTSATTFPGVTASTSRGTGTSPLVNNTGDLTGGFSGWGYTQASPAYTYMAGMSISMVGGTSSLGGQLDFYTKADGSTTTTSGLTIKNDQTLALPHYTAAGILHNAVTTGAITSSLVSLTADVSGILPIANGGTGSATQNWVDLTTNQTIATGHKTLTQDQTFNGRLFTGASIIPTVNQVDSIGTPSLMYSRIYTNSLLTSFFIGQGAGGKFSITTGGTTGDILWSLNNTVTNIATFFHTTGDAVFQTTTSPIVDSTAYKMNIYGRTRISQFTAASTNDSLMAFNPTTHALRMTKLVAGTGVSLAYASGNITVSTANTPILQASADLTAQSAAGNVTTFTVGASTATFNISGYINITAVTVDVIEMQVTYTDENSTSQTANFFTQGATSALLSAIGNSVYPPMVIRAKNGTVITVKTTLTTGTGSIQFDTGSRVTQM